MEPFIMKKFVFLSILCAAALLICSDASAKSKKTDKENFRYDIEYVKSAGTGMNTVRLGSYTKDKKENEDLARRNAVHAVIFKGYAGNGATMPALAKDPDTEANNADFFQAFFAQGGDAGRFVTGVTSSELMKVGKEYKYTATVTINSAALRKYLEQKGIIRALSSGF